MHVNPMVVNVKYYGQIVAGQPMPIPDDSDFANDEHSLVEVAPSMIGNADPAEVFALRVKGDSMIDAMIQDGDIVILRPVDQVKNGEMVAVYLQERGETTLKHYFLEKDGMVRLQPRIRPWIRFSCTPALPGAGPRALRAADAALRAARAKFDFKKR
ncbi:MAG: hypothetical protein IPK52_22390 [Chloroflexi bacterium]|nr:hypothetical protein [Chloroflexota bacterium]